MNAARVVKTASVFGAPLVVGAHFALLLLARRTFGDAASAATLASSAFAVAVTTAAAWAVSRGFSGTRRAASAVTLGLSVITATAFCLMVEIIRARYAVLVAAPAVSFFFIRSLADAAARREAAPAHAHVAFLAHVVTVFFTFFAAFTINDYFSVHVLAIAAGVAVIGGAVAWASLETATDEGRYAPLAVVFGLVFGEAYLGLHVLPIPASASAVVGTAIAAAAIHIARLALGGAYTLRAWRREFAMMLLLMIMVLATAQWT